MDEPTNHLDVEGILWLEGAPDGAARAFLVVSHDRYFLEHVATRMLELNRAYPGGLFETDGRYSDFLARRDEFLRGQAAYQESLANTVRREIEWLRRGAKARSTKAKGRIKEAGRLDRRSWRTAAARGATAAAGIDFASSQRRTRRLLAARGLTKSLGGRRARRRPRPRHHPGHARRPDRPERQRQDDAANMLAGALPPDAGEIERADGLRIVRFAQERGGLDPDPEPAPRARARGRRRHLAGPQRPRRRRGPSASCSSPSSSRCPWAVCRAASRPASSSRA